MLHTLKQTYKKVMPLRITICNDITPTINTKKPRPVFVDRENPDTPPVITEYVREFARLMKNFNQLVRMPANPTDYTKRREVWYLSVIADNNLSGDKYRTISRTKKDTATITEANKFAKFHAWITIPGVKTVNGGYCEHHPYKPLLYGGKIETCADNVNNVDKPAFRHDSLYLFDLLSEDHSA